MCEPDRVHLITRVATTDATARENEVIGATRTNPPRANRVRDQGEEGRRPRVRCPGHGTRTGYTYTIPWSTAPTFPVPDQAAL
ncbi:hypothetical protein GCM10009642_06090 [Nocardiopsis metallicus]